MPTFNQLVKQGRKSVAKKSNSPALQSSYNSLKKKSVNTSSPQKRGVCLSRILPVYLSAWCDIRFFQQGFTFRNQA